MSENALNEIHAYFGKLSTTTTKKVSQWAYGQKLVIHDPELPPVFEAYYSNSRSRGTADPQIGTDGVVDAPHAYFRSGADIYVFLMVHEGTDDGRYNKIVHIPIDPCSEPSDVEPEPYEQGVIDQAIAALNSAVEQCETYVEHYPTVIDGYWYTWDEATEQFVTTGVPATGNGIASARLNSDYTLTLVFTDGTSFTTPISIRGAQGEKGDTGAVPDFSIGTVTTLPAGSSASASITGTQEEPILNLSIPQGQDGAITNLDTTLTVSAKAADAKAVGNRIAKLPDSALTDAEGVDLDVADADGNVIVRLADGHVQTKNFDSSKIKPNVDAKPSSSTADLVLTDNFGNALVEFDDGHVRTKSFDSSTIEGAISEAQSVLHSLSGTDYAKTFTYDADVATEQTITGDFREGDTILCHLSNADDDVTDFLYTKLVSYGYIDTRGVEHTLGQEYGYRFARFVLPENASAIFGSFPTGLLGTGTYSFRFLVYKLSGYKRQPHVVTVGADGRRQFTSVRAAMDSFHDNNEYNTYELWVYPGTYDILSDFTDEEIRADGFKGLWVKNGVRIVGQGHREQIILHGEIDPNEYSSTIRNQISTLNMSGNCGLENITVTNRYLRYAVHDDHTSGYYANQTRIVENCKFLSTDAASGGIGQAAYGAGGHNSKKLIVRNCDLGDRFIIHNTQHMYVPMTAIVENCFAQIVTLTDNNDPPFTAPTRIEFNNCNFDYVRHDKTTDGADPTMILQGTGSHDIKLDCEAGTLYNFGDCSMFPGAISAGQAVKMNNSVSIAATASLADIYGISIGNDGTHTYVQRRGYINNNVLGLTGLAVGDYVTLDASGIVTATGATASNAIGVVECIDTQMTTAFIKLLFK